MAAAAYPPERHVLRDLRFVTERDASGSVSRLEITPFLLAPSGAAHAGVLATLVDLAGGEAALRAAQPGWVATSDLVLHEMRPVSRGVVSARPNLLRRTRSTVVVEVTLAAAGRPVGLGTMSFAVLPAREDLEAQSAVNGQLEPRTDFARPGSGLSLPLSEALAARTVDLSKGVVEIPVTPWVGNSLGALQGGMAAMAVELGALALGTDRLGPQAAVVDLAINYLRLLRVGPARTRARVLRAQEGTLLARVELRDAGAGDEPCAVASALLQDGA